MSQIKLEIPTGAINGVNRVFTVSRSYITQSVAVYFSGTLHRADNTDGWVETSPLLGTITLNEAPLIGDDIQVLFLYNETTSSVSPNSEKNIFIKASIYSEHSIDAKISKNLEIKTQINLDARINTKLDFDPIPIKGSIANDIQIKGIVVRS